MEWKIKLLLDGSIRKTERKLNMKCVECKLYWRNNETENQCIGEGIVCHKFILNPKIVKDIKYKYFVSFQCGMNGCPVFGNTMIEMDKLIESIEDIRKIQDGFMKQRNDIVNPIIISYQQIK